MITVEVNAWTLPRSVYALLTDGTTVEIRPGLPEDLAAVQAMHEAMSPDTTYLRFFNYSRLSAAEEAKRVCRPTGPGHHSLLALRGGEIVAVGGYEIESTGRRADAAFAVADRWHGRGLGTLLLEHLVSDAVRRGVTTFTASVLLRNSAMQRVFADAGLSVQHHLEDGVLEFTCALPRDHTDRHWDLYLDAAAARERRADVASLRHVFQPEPGRDLLDQLADTANCTLSLDPAGSVVSASGLIASCSRVEVDRSSRAYPGIESFGAWNPVAVMNWKR